MPCVSQKMLLADQLFRYGICAEWSETDRSQQECCAAFGAGLEPTKSLVINPDEGDTWFHQFWIDEGINERGSE